MKTKNHAQAKYKLDHTPGPGVIGIVPKLAPGATNPMWAIQESLPTLAEVVAPILRATEPIKPKYRAMNVSSKGKYLMKVEKIKVEPTVKDLREAETDELE